MDKEIFDELLASTCEMGKKPAARVPEFSEVEIKSLREKVGLSQGKFALLIAVSKRTLKNWEQGHRLVVWIVVLDTPAHSLLAATGERHLPHGV